MSNKTSRGVPKTYPKRGVYTLNVKLVGGPVLEEFVKKNPIVSRRIEIRGCLTLDDLHWAIFYSHDRDEDHLYEFQFGGKPNARGVKRFGCSPGKLGLFDEIETKSSNVVLDELKLKVGEVFYYWFDFGDDWWHEITVVAIDDKAQGTERPRVIESIGNSPPQYPFVDEQDEFEDDESEDGEFDDEEPDDEELVPEEAAQTQDKESPSDPSARA